MATIVLLHGWGRGSKSLGVLKKFLENKGHAVYGFDLPGFGVVPPPAAPWVVDDYVRFVLDFTEQHKLRHFFLFGHSFGGRIAIKFAVAHPEKLKGLILSDAAGITPRPKVKIAVFRFFSRVGNWIFSFFVLSIFRELARGFVYWLSGEHDYYFLQNEVMRETFKKAISEQLRDYLPKIKTPTLILWGKNDKMTLVADAHMMYREIKGSRLEVLEGVGHTPHVECPEKVAGLIDQFIIHEKTLKTIP